jgi:hypothetical protein
LFIYICVRYGDSIGTLNVYLFNGSYTRLWSLTGNRGNNWYEGQVSYVSLGPHQIIVDGIAGKDYLVRLNSIIYFKNQTFGLFREIFQSMILHLQQVIVRFDHYILQYQQKLQLFHQIYQPQ